MGFRLRKSFTIGGVRITTNKSGVSYSTGFKGLRVTKKANGNITTTASIPKTGISYTNTSRKIKMENAKGKTSSEFLLFVTSILTTIVITIIFTYSYISIQNKQIEEERTKHTWQTDFNFPFDMDLNCIYIENKGYQYIIKWAIKNESGYDATIHHVYIRFYDENNHALTTYDINNIGCVKNGETKKFSNNSTMYYSKVPKNTFRIHDIKYDLNIKL